MVQANACPEADLLQRYLLGQTSDQEASQLESHLAGCAHCVQTLHGLQAEDTFVDAMRAQSRAKGGEEEVVEALIERIQTMVPGEKRGETTALHVAIDFLAPPQSAGELGRLGSYSIRKILGAGGMGIVFEAEDPALGRHVALKVMRPPLAADADARARFLREARAIASIHNDHIVTVHQVGEDRNVPFLAMPLLQGETLDARIKRMPRLLPGEILEIGRQIANGLAAAHDRGLVHRDIKPANIWLEPTGAGKDRVKILDFGLVRVVGDDASQTRDGAIIGTPHYMAPEQAKTGAIVDYRCDLFGLGCLLYRLCTGQVPFAGEGTMSTLLMLALETPKSPRTLNPAVPRALSDLIDHLLAKEPSARPTSARVVSEALAAIAQNPAAPLHIAGMPEVVVAPRRRWPMFAAAAAVLLGFLTLIGFLAAPTIIRIATPRGTLIIETDDPNIEVVVKKGGAKILDRTSQREIELSLGEYEIELAEPNKGLQLSTKEFKLTDKDKKVRVKVTADLAAAPRPPDSVGPATPPKDPRLTAEIHAIFQEKCHRCHGQDGAVEGGFNYLMDGPRLVARKKIVPGSPEKSSLYQRIVQGEMPPKGQSPRPSESDIAAIRKWIESGAPSPEVPQRTLLTTADVTRIIHDDLKSLNERDRRFARYFTLAHLYNAGLSDDELLTYRHAISKLINSLSWGREVLVPKAIDPARTVLRIDLRDYKWNETSWEMLLSGYPYGVVQEGDAAKFCYDSSACEVPHVRGDWFVATASRPPLYYQLLQLPTTAAQLESQLHVDASGDIRNERVVRAGFNGSGVSRNNRILERHDSTYGAYWKSYDFASNTDARNIFSHPNSFQADGGEIIFNLPNGLQAYMLVNATGQRIEQAPINIVSDLKRPDRMVTAGISCMNCHSRGLNEKTDQIREHVTSNAKAFPNPEADAILALYPPAEKFLKILRADNERVQQALARTGAPATSAEPIVAIALRFESEVDMPLAAAEIGVKRDELVQAIDRSAVLARVLGPIKVAGGTVQRQVFVDCFPEVVRELKIGRPYAARATSVAQVQFRRGSNPRILAARGQVLNNIFTVETTQGDRDFFVRNVKSLSFLPGNQVSVTLKTNEVIRGRLKTPLELRAENEVIRLEPANVQSVAFTADPLPATPAPAAADTVKADASVFLDATLAPMLFSRDGKWLYLLNMTTNKVQRLNLEKNQIDSTVADLTEGTEGMALAPNGATLYTYSTQIGYKGPNTWPPKKHPGVDGGGFTSKIHVIDAATLKVKDSFTIPFDPFDIVADDKGRVYLTAGSGQWTHIAVVDTVKHAVVERWPGRAAIWERSWLRMTADQQRLYIGETGISPSTNRRIAMPPPPGPGFPPGGGPGGRFELTPDDKFLIAGKGDVLRLGKDAKDDLKAFAGVEAHITSVTDRGGRWAFVATPKGELKVYSYPDFQLLTSIFIGTKLYQMGFDEKTQTLYGAATANVPRAGDGRALFGKGNLEVYKLKETLARLKAPDRPRGLVIEATLKSGKSVRGELEQTMITIETGQGAKNFAPQDAKSLGFHGNSVLLTLKTSDTVQGKLQTPALKVKTDVGVLTLTAENLQSVAFVIDPLLPTGPKPVEAPQKIAGADLQPAHVLKLDSTLAPMLFSKDRKWLFLLNLSEKKVRRFNLEKKELDALSIEVNAGTESMVLSLSGSTLYTCSTDVGYKGPNTWPPKGVSPRTCKIHVIDAEGFKLKDSFTIPFDPFDMVADDNGRLYLTAGSSQWTRIAVVDVAKRAVVAEWGSLWERSWLRMTPDQQKLYTGDTGISPLNHHGLELPAKPEGANPQMRRSPYHGTQPIGSRFELTPDGRFLISGKGGVLRLAKDAGNDLQIATKLEPHVTSTTDRNSRWLILATQKGELRIYSYPDLELKSAVLIGTKVYQMAFDDKTQTLYAATTAAIPMSGDGRALFGQGDLFVYSLKDTLARISK